MLTHDQLDQFKKTLGERSSELRAEVRLELLASEEQHYIDLAGRVHDIGEASVADLLVDLQLASVDRHIEELGDIDAALRRIGDGRYGVCIDCRASIATDRLRAYPTAKRCRPCQVKYERSHATEVGPSL